MELKIPTREAFRAFYESDLKTAFPEEELKPCAVMEQLWDKGVYRPWCLFDGDKIIGCAVVWQHEPGWVLFEYLCVTARERGGGLGSELIALLLQAERGSVVFGESEIPDFAPDPAMARRRMGFYQRNGAKRAFYDVTLFGVPFHTLYWSDGAVDETVLLEKHRAVYRSHFTLERYEKFITIPWDESMGAPQRRPWEEDV